VQTPSPQNKKGTEDGIAATTSTTSSTLTLPAPLRLLQRLLREHALANALSSQQQAVLQEGLA
jgi:hypothetical protein